MYGSRAMITVNDLSFSYKGGQKNAITRLTFEVNRGEVFGFLGPSGAGKSTTQKVLIRLLRQYEGSVSVFNRNLEDWGPDYFEQIGVSFEFPTHFLKLTGIANLTYFSRLYRRPTHSPTLLLRWVGLHDDGRMRVYLSGDNVEHREFLLSGLCDNSEFLDLLRTHEVQTMHSLEASLEDVFILLTGRRL